MRKVILLLFLFSCVGCAQSLYIVWEPNPVYERIECYKVYVFEKVDTTGWTIADMDSIAIVPHNPVAMEYSYNYNFQTNMIIKAGLVAVDSLTRKSEMSFSPFYNRPTENMTVRIKK